MRLIGWLLALSTVAGIYCWGGNSLDEKRVRDFYEMAHQATFAYDHERLCAMLAEDFEMISLIRIESAQAREVYDKTRWCGEVKQIMEQLQHMSAKLGRDLPIEYSLTITSVVVAADGHSAMVKSRSTLELPGFSASGRHRETVVRRRWKTRFQHSEGVWWVGAASS